MGGRDPNCSWWNCFRPGVGDEEQEGGVTERRGGLRAPGTRFPGLSIREKDLEQRVLQVLRDAGSPVKSLQLAKECQVPKKKLNQVLYRMRKESKVSLEGQAIWGLGQGGTGEVVPAEPAQPSQAERPQRDAVAIPEEPGLQLTKQQEDIYRILKANGPCKALTISQKLGRKTAKDVNPDLYAMRRKHLLDLDEKSRTWAIYQPDLGGRKPATTIIYQKNPINLIRQHGPNNLISIDNSEDIQIGHGNVIVRTTASGECGSMAPLHPPPVAPADPSTQGSPAAAWGPQDIRLEKSVLRRVQMGHGNKMDVNDALAKGPATCSPLGSPPVSATTDSPAASFEIRMPKPGPSSEGEVTQRVHISSCFLEDTAIGNSNRMTVSSEIDGPGEVARPEDGRRDPGEPGKDTGAEPGSQFSHDCDQASPDNGDVLTFISHLEAVTLESKDLQSAEDSGRVDRTPGMDSWEQVESRTNSQALSGRAGKHQ
ncbi:Z-DNA-binding protein 1 isoform X2 [Ailuropoda melanoleuca]|uniref:Z-DNA binding protein 1 n=1 Tax=Ailuropoda melanoleuca TaxID=9646 RepID=A0A7N5JQU4_AILME|nr:Z-DNA-binding protein 1 isoform X2 [Ailuropoda melanoleuca]